MTQEIANVIFLETQEYHKALMVSSFGTAMQLETLPREKYVGLLQSYTVIYRALEETLRSNVNPSVAKVWREDLSKVTMLERDLEFFNVTAGSGPPAAIALAEQLAAEIRGNSTVALLGYLYVMEGSTLGAEAVLRRHVESAFDLDADRGAAYFNSGDRTKWRQFIDQLNAVMVDDVEQKSLLSTVIVTYQHVLDIQATLH